MRELISALFFAGLVLIAWLVWRALVRGRTYSASIDRLEEAPSQAELDVIHHTGPLRALHRRHWLPPIISAIVFAIAYWGFDVPLIFCGAFGMVGYVFTVLLDSRRVEKTSLKLELQLADAIDLMVGSVRAGLGAVDALIAARRETGKPLGPLFGDLIGRLRLGDDPQSAVALMSQRVPLESFRLFASALAVHWEIGGSLGPTLTGVGRTIRDRVELGRRVKAQGTQARVSVIVFVLVTYFMGVVTWQGNPDRMQAFIQSGIGSILVAGAILLQAVGILWINRMAKIPY